MTITRVDLPVKIVSVDTLRSCVRGLGKRLMDEKDMKKRVRIIIIKEEIKELIKQL
jgi:hypothetical protein